MKHGDHSSLRSESEPRCNDGTLEDASLRLMINEVGSYQQYGALDDENSLLSPGWKEVMTAKEVPRGSSKASIFNLVSTILGGGALSLPYAFACTGLGSGVVLLLMMSLASTYSARLLLSCAYKTKQRSYQDIAKVLYGPKGGTCVNFLVFLLVSLACVGYIVLMGDLLTSLLPPIFPGNSQIDINNNRVAIMGSCILVIYPVTLFRDLSALRVTSFVSVLATVILAVCVIDKSISELNNSNAVPDPIPSRMDTCVTELLPHQSKLECIEWIRFDWDFFLAIPILSCAYMCHFNVLPVHKELRNSTQKRMNCVINATMGCSAALYLVIAVFGYLSKMQSLLGKEGGNILNMFSKHDPAITVGRIGLAATLLLSFPLLTHPCRTLLEEMLFDKFWAPSQLRNWFVSTFVSVSCYLLAILIPTITVVWTIMGSTVAQVVAYVLPAAFYLKLVDGPVTSKQKFPALVMLMLGSISSVVCTIASFWNAINPGSLSGKGS